MTYQIPFCSYFLNIFGFFSSQLWEYAGLFEKSLYMCFTLLSAHALLERKVCPNSSDCSNVGHCIPIWAPSSWKGRLFLWPRSLFLQVLAFLNEFGRLSGKSLWAMTLSGFSWNQQVFPANCLLLILWWIVRSARKLTGKEDNASFLYFFLDFLYISWTGNLLLTKTACSAHKLKNITTSATTYLWKVKIFECYYTIQIMLHLTETAGRKS